MAVRVPLKKAKENLEAVLTLAERDYVVVVKNNRRFVISRIDSGGLTEEQAARIGEQAEAEYRSGKTRSLESFIRSHHPHYAKLLATNSR